MKITFLIPAEQVRNCRPTDSGNSPSAHGRYAGKNSYRHAHIRFDSYTPAKVLHTRSTFMMARAAIRQAEEQRSIADTAPSSGVTESGLRIPCSNQVQVEDGLGRAQ